MNTKTPKKRGKALRFFVAFWRFLWRSLKAFNTIVFGLLALLVVAALIFTVVGQRPPSIPAGGALVLNPSGTLVEQRTAVAPSAVLQGRDLPQQALVKDIIDALKLAQDDGRVSLLVLDLSDLQQGLMPKLVRIANAISEFKSSGKKVIAVADNYSQSALYLAAHADEVLMNAEGIAVVEGFAVNSLYFKKLLDDNDVSINVFKAGQYKSAAEPFTRNDMSPPAQEALLAIVDKWWQTYTQDIETARGLTAGSLNNIMQNLPDKLRLAEGNLAQLTLNAGLVDRLVTDAEQSRYLIELAGENTETKNYRGIDYNSYLSSVRFSSEQTLSKIAVITAVGNIVNGQAPAGTIGGESLSKLIRKARMNEKVEAILLRVDSGGGSKTASEKIRAELKAAQDDGIAVVASMGSIAGSGGYWIAASADEIWASPTTVTGSIGVIGLIPGFENALAKYGITTDGVATTPIAGNSLLKELSPELREVMQLTINAAYRQFLSTVADGRNMEIDAVNEIAQGRVWTGEAAQQLGLVDKLGDFEQAVSSAAGLAGLDDYSLWYVEPEISIEDKLLQQLVTHTGGVLSQTVTGAFYELVSKLRSEISVFDQLNDPLGAYVICTDCPVIP